MEVTISAEMLVELAALLTALGVIGGVVVWGIRFVSRQKKQDQELVAIRREQTLICYGLSACLRGLKELGCDGPVKDGLDRLEKHLNQAAHEEDTE